MTIAEALELTALVARKQPHRYGRFAARWLCLYLEEHEQATLEDVEVLVSNLRPSVTINMRIPKPTPRGRPRGPVLPGVLIAPPRWLVATEPRAGLRVNRAQ